MTQRVNMANVIVRRGKTQERLQTFGRERCPSGMRIALVVLFLCSGAHAQEPLNVPGFRPASFVAASGTGPRPVVVILHGNFDRPEWDCAAWAPIVHGRAFLLCPRGIPRRDAPGLDRWTHNQPQVLLREVAAGRAALSARFPGRVDEGPDVWIGFSLGAHRVAALAMHAPTQFRLLQLVEGGNSFWQEGGAQHYARGGGRVAIVCAQAGCLRQGTRFVEHVGEAQARVERIESCHSCLDVMAPAIARTFDWLVSEDPRF